jgi:hypothetical protein
MRDSTAIALASTPAPKKAMPRTMGKLVKMRLRPSKRDSFRASTREYTFTSKIEPATGSLCGNCRPGSQPTERRSAGLEVASTVVANSSASLRSVRTETLRFPLRRGNDAPWKTPQSSFPPRLKIRQKAPDFHIPTASTAATSHYLKLSRAPPHRIR